HSDGLLEYPLYTRPARWEDPAGVVREAPPILLSGDHGRIAAWRSEQSLERTRQRRPDLLGPAGDAGGRAQAQQAEPGAERARLRCAAPAGTDPTHARRD